MTTSPTPLRLMDGINPPDSFATTATSPQISTSKDIYPPDPLATADTALQPSTAEGSVLSSLLQEARSKIEFFQFPRWYVCLNRNGLNVVYISAQDNTLVPRNIVCASSGHVELYVHGQLISVNQFLKKGPPQVPLTPSTINVN